MSHKKQLLVAWLRVCVWAVGWMSISVVEEVRAQTIWMESSAQASSAEVVPYYHYFNSGGRWSSEQVSSLQRLIASYRKGIGRIHVEVGAEAYLRGEAPYLYLQEAYLLPRYGKLELLMGRISEDKLYRPYPKPSIGDMGLSDNVAPITRIGVTLSDYLSLPRLREWVSVHGRSIMGGLKRIGTFGVRSGTKSRLILG